MANLDYTSSLQSIICPGASLQSTQALARITSHMPILLMLGKFHSTTHHLFDHYRAQKVQANSESWVRQWVHQTTYFRTDSTLPSPLVAVDSWRTAYASCVIEANT